MAKKGESPTSLRDDPQKALSDGELEELYEWVDSFALSRTKKNISRDFSDGVGVAELACICQPKLVDLHNYTPSNGFKGKKQNWEVLNRKVFSKLHFQLAEDVIKGLCEAKPGVIEKVLIMLRTKLESVAYEQQNRDKPEADQYHLSPGRKGHRGQARKMTMEETSKGGQNVHKQIEKEEKLLLEQHVPQRRMKHSKSAPDPNYIPRIVLEGKEQELRTKEETVAILQAKISRLEHLLHLKDLRIEELQARVESIRATGIKR